MASIGHHTLVNIFRVLGSFFFFGGVGGGGVARILKLRSDFRLFNTITPNSENLSCVSCAVLYVGYSCGILLRNYFTIFDNKDLHRKLIDTEATAARRIVVNTLGKHVLGLSEVDLK
jgi:hypothetical protein